MRVLVCGGREYTDRARVFHALDVLHARIPITFLIEGGQRGADTLAHEWAVSRGVPNEREPANWTAYGKAAGHMRNALMLEKYAPEAVVAFPGNRGTADMCKKARAFGLKVWCPFKE